LIYLSEADSYRLNEAAFFNKISEALYSKIGSFFKTVEKPARVDGSPTLTGCTGTDIRTGFAEL
jgi:hypothetical protein